MSAAQVSPRTSSSAQRSSMDRTRIPTDRSAAPSASPGLQQAKPEKMRKRLQKTPPRRSASSNLSLSFKAGANPVVQQTTQPIASSPRVPPDLSDAKWQEYLRRSGMLAMDSSSPLPGLSPLQERADANNVEQTPTIIPEFKHLAINNTPPRPLLTSLGTNSPTSSTSTASSVKRRAKTPVTSIGQLEAGSFGRNSTDASKVTSVDRIAAQYQALLEPSDTDSIYTDCYSDPPPRSERRLTSSGTRRQDSSEEVPPHHVIAVPPPRRGNTQAHSPTSDDGTLVGFDEEAIYFKPLSFSPEPPSVLHHRVSTMLRRSVPQGNFGLQLCVDLLTRELATAMLDRPGVSPDAPALQILVMIEAYERLRNQVLEMGLQRDEPQGVETMFDTWLGALYSLHDSLSGESWSRSDTSSLP
ncbi:hypothetical protein VdG2_04478 [Verticillium dahliae VDG2]|nr:hypothetical protein VdG2_04478 [Verticillium dahliae VDG2]